MQMQRFSHRTQHRVMLALSTQVLVGLLLLAISVPTPARAVLGPDTGVDWALTPAQISAVCKSELASARARIHAIDRHAGKATSMAKGLGAVETVDADLTEALSAPTNLSALAVSKEVRDASSQCSDDFNAFAIELAADPAVYKLAQAAAKSAHDPEDEQLAKIYSENGRRNAAGLDAATRAKVTQLFDQLNTLQINFARALAEDQTHLSLTSAELASLPPALASALEHNAHGADIAVNESTVGPFLESETSAAARARYWMAYHQIGGTANVQRLTDAVTLRQQLAALLGFPSWAAYQLDIKMAKTPERALALVQQVSTALLPKGRAEVKALADLKLADGDSTPFAEWDYRFYEHELEKTRYALDAELVRQYFPVDKVVPAVLDIYAHLLGVRFEELSPVKAWAPGIREFAIYDGASGAGIGWFFLDLYPRPGKYQHFAAFPLRFGRQLADGSYRLPVSAIIGNWTLPEPGKTTLLSHDEVITFFHEFGHVMHETLSHTRYASLFGINVRGDFGEAPSQMLENWMWQPSVLKKVSAHVGTGEPLPDELIGKMIAAQHLGDGEQWGRQAFLAGYDLELHSQSGKPDPSALWFALKPRMTPYMELPGTFPEARFGHLMNGYDAGYYGYLWAKVFAQDMFSEFLKGGLDNPAVGLRYRQMILVPGGSVEPDVLLRRFLGREVSFEPFYEDLGLKTH